MTQYRDLVLKRQARESQKQDRLIFKRAVLTTEGGLQTSSDPLNDVWASLSEKRVWYMTEGAVQPAQILCRKVSDPYVGLGVIIGLAEGSNQLEVLTDDFFLTATGDPTGWASSSPRDLEPGGRKQMWVYTKVIVPLATYPGTGIAVNVVSGDYPYGGARKTFAGSVNFALAQNPNAGEHYLAGLYLDSSNTLQVVYGASVATTITPPEPSWPAGAFRLSVVRINDTQTSIDFVNDIFDRRMAWGEAESGAGGNVWPKPDKLNIGATEYATLALAIAALGSGDNLMAGEGIYTINDGQITTPGQLIGSGRGATFLREASSAASSVIQLDLSGEYAIQDLTIDPPKTTIEGLNLNDPGLDLQLTNVNIFVDADEAVGLGEGVVKCINILGASEMRLFNCWLRATGVSGGSRSWYTLYAQGGTTLVNAACLLDGPILVATGASVILDGCTWVNATFTPAGGTLTGHYYDDAGNHITLNTTGKTSGVWLVDESAGLKIKQADLATALTAAASSGDSIKLDTDTYTVTGTLSLGKSLTIEGDGPEATIIDFTGSNQAAFDLTTDSTTIIFRNLTLQHTGGGTAATGIFSNNAVTVILDNAQVLIPGGTPGTGRALWIEGGTWELRNGAKALSTDGTDNYAIYNDSAAATVIIGPGCEVGGATADVYGDQAGSALGVDNCTFTNGYTNWAGDVTGQYHGAKLVTNASGATAPGRDTGYINAAGDYVTTTTANYFGSNCIVVVGGGNTKKCFVATSGGWPIRYAGSAPNDGDFLVTSTTAGAAAGLATMRPEIFARCQAAGSSNVVMALLLTNTTFVPYSSANQILHISSHSATSFSSTITGAPAATSFVYNAPTGNENSIAPSGTTQLGKILMANTTRSTNRHITAVNTGTNTVTNLSVTDAWANTDAIQANSQTCLSGGSPFFFDIDLSQQTEIPALARALSLTMFHSDSAGNSFVALHPFETFSNPKQKIGFNYSTAVGSYTPVVIVLISQKFCFRASAAGAGTALTQLTIDGYWLAVP